MPGHPFEAKSIRKYSFESWMFRDGEQSHCFSLRNWSSPPRARSEEPAWERNAALLESMSED